MRNLHIILFIPTALGGAIPSDHLRNTNSILHSRSDQDCKCTPGQLCWPRSEEWVTLNSTVSGRLIATQPVAISCYPGPFQNQNLCSNVVAQRNNASFQAIQPLGLDYPTNDTCPPVNYTSGDKPASCSIGFNPIYAVNATRTEDVTAALAFAATHNIRVVIKSTGHDLLGRSEGYGSLQIWLRYMRTGISFQSRFSATSVCQKSDWTGSIIKVGGGYTWSDVYPIAQANNVIVVGGGTPSVSCIGGWMQGGGHGPASRQFGLGADQVLEAEVALANGTIVTANSCQNTDLFFAIRGGGPGTYGVVLSTIIKAWPMVDQVAVQHLAIAPLPITDSASLLDAISILFSAYPDLNDAGYAGYGSWTTSSPVPLFANFTAGYVHSIYMFNKTIEQAKAAFYPVRAKLAPRTLTNLYISETYTSYPDYWSFYKNESGVEPPVGGSFSGGSRLFDRASVQSNTTLLRETLSILAGSPDQFTFNGVELVSGGQVFADASDLYSGILPAWRSSYFNNIVSRSIPPNASEATRNAIMRDITDVMVRAMVELAPQTGAYMNEADRTDPDFERNFYGKNYDRLASIKAKYDPRDLFYCPTCVGSAKWKVQAGGELCRV